MRLFGSPDEVSKAISEAGLQEWHDQLLASARPTVQYVADSERGDTAPIGVSRMGGTPDLPPTLTWPLRPPYTDAKTRNAEIRYHPAVRLRSPDYQLQNDRRNKIIGMDARLPFIAQIDLAEAWRIQQFGCALPKHGRLLFFYDARETPPGFDPADAAGFRVLWDTTPVSELVPVMPMSELAVDALVFAKKKLRPTPGLLLPEWETFAYERIGLPGSELDKYDKLRDTYGEADQLPEAGWRGRHYLGGWADRISGASADMELECELVTRGVSIGSGYPEAEAAQARLRRADWCLLAQFDCGDLNEGHEFHEWFTRLRLFFWIKSEDLVARRFERVWVLTR